MFADNLKCISGDPAALLRAARLIVGHVRLVGQEPAPRKCVLLSTSRAVRGDIRRWVVTDEGDRWSVKLDVRYLGGHLDSTCRGWSATLATRVRLVIVRLVLIFALPLDFHGRLRVILVRVLWSRRQSLANSGAVLSMLDGPSGCDPRFALCGFGSVCFVGVLLVSLVRFLTVYRLLEHAAEIGFVRSPDVVGWVREGLPVLSNLAGQIQHFESAVLEGWRGDVDGTLQLLNSTTFGREKKRCFGVSLMVVSGMVFCLRRVRISGFLVGFVVFVIMMVIFLETVLFHL